MANTTIQQKNQTGSLPWQQQLTHIVKQALAEDLELSVEQVEQYPTSVLLVHDLTTSATVDPARISSATFVVKQPGVIAGLAAINEVFSLLDPNAQVEILVPDGTKISEVPAVVARVRGLSAAILTGERTALNIIQRLCGVATAANAYAAKAAPFGIAILDTRKTTPGMRHLEKYAAKTGGVTNHRVGLSDAVLIKDNHIRAAGGISAAVAASRKINNDMPVEVEVTNKQELEEALEMKAEKVLLDNMSPEQIKNCVDVVAGRTFIEVSGGINANNLDAYLIEGVDAISIGAITHSVASLDISLEIEDES